MHVFVLIVASVQLPFAATATAEPPKAATPSTEQLLEQSAAIVVAAANDVSTTSATEIRLPDAAKSERKARVTTCRCGDQTPKN